MMMTRLPMTHLPMTDVTSGRGGIVANSSKTPTYQGILAKMQSEQPSLYASLKCWYSPKLQGLTNAELSDNYGEYDGGLHDLSGNGYDMTIYGMTGEDGDGYVDADGHLVFDGVDDQATTESGASPVFEDFTLFSRSYDFNVNGFVSIKASTSGSQTPRIWGYGYQNQFCFAKVTTEGKITHSMGTKRINTYVMQSNPYVLTINGTEYSGTRGTATDSADYQICIGSMFVRVWRNMALYYQIVFDRTLTSEETEWVNNNMLY